MPRSPGDAQPPASTVRPEHFEGLYSVDADPWNFTTSWYERRKYALTVAALPQERYASAFEVGCSIGAMTALLAPRCDALLAVDCAPTAVQSARLALQGLAHVTIEQAQLPAELPDEAFDLVVTSEVLYYFTGADLTRLLDGLISRLRPGGDIVLAHWRASDKSYGYDGFNVHDTVQRRPELDTVVHHEDENFVLDVLRR
ncbi:MAG: SAM-dependent methyltransferase [Pseudonocardiaceae bacterium]